MCHRYIHVYTYRHDMTWIYTYISCATIHRWDQKGVAQVWMSRRSIGHGWETSRRASVGSPRRYRYGRRHESVQLRRGNIGEENFSKPPTRHEWLFARSSSPMNSVPPTLRSFANDPAAVLYLSSSRPKFPSKAAHCRGCFRLRFSSVETTHLWLLLAE